MMKSFFQKNTFPISLDKLIRWTGQKIIVPFYHTVSDEDLPYIKHLYHYKNSADFRKDIEFLLAHYEPINLTHLSQIVEKNIQQEKPVFHLMFDDGLKEIYHVVRPILQEYNIPYSVAINSSFVNNRDFLFRFKASILVDALIQDKSKMDLLRNTIPALSNIDIAEHILNINFNQKEKLNEYARKISLDLDESLRLYRPYLSSEEMKILQAEGVTFVAHSADHPRFENIDAQEQKKQISDSVNYLKVQWQVQDNYFAFPFSDQGAERPLFDWMYEEQDIRLSFGTAGLKNDSLPRHVQRIAMELSLSAQQIIQGEYQYYCAKALIGKNTINR